MADLVYKRLYRIFDASLQETGETMSEFIRRFKAEHGFGSRQHLFKILGGTAPPGERTLPYLASSLGVDLDKLQMARRADVLENKAKEMGVSSKDSTAVEIAAKVDKLSPKERKNLLRLLENGNGHLPSGDGKDA